LSSELRNNQHFHRLDWNILEDYMSYLVTKLIRGYSSIPSVGAAGRRGVERLLPFALVAHLHFLPLWEKRWSLPIHRL